MLLTGYRSLLVYTHGLGLLVCRFSFDIYNSKYTDYRCYKSVYAQYKQVGRSDGHSWSKVCITDFVPLASFPFYPLTLY